eukprot:TRINITY_DN2056_c0_g1_i1.p1 TRINITY_DN2056_c0_g1~~TRINITY_DN2056_c0_g1_i1.p1  ORF type:complete len:135 (+),score=25.91 TRINITY_DN2056_c0_g1_i1:265-669(+)
MVLGLVGVCMDFKHAGQRQVIAIVLLFKEGGSLRKCIDARKEPYSAKRMLGFGVQLTQGLAHLHEHGYKHCDIAARNYLMSEVEDEDAEPENQVIVLTDFGLTRPFDFGEKGDRLFPWRWCAPETIKIGWNMFR